MSTTTFIKKPIPVNKAQCATCPFRKEGWSYLQGLLTSRALGSSTPICHSTGPQALVPKKKRIHAKAHACRGARNLQIAFFYRLGFLDAPTDEAWYAKIQEINNESKKTAKGNRDNRRKYPARR